MTVQGPVKEQQPDGMSHGGGGGGGGSDGYETPSSLLWERVKSPAEAPKFFSEGSGIYKIICLQSIS